jgi:hypothetical protein
MNPEKFAELVVSTLNAQGHYFKTRKQEDLIAARTLEAQLRKEAEAIVAQEKGLFDSYPD